MKITPTAIPEVLLIEPDDRGYERGFFMVSWHYQLEQPGRRPKIHDAGTALLPR